MITPPFEIGDIVMIKPFKGCSVGAEFCRINLIVERCERAPVEPEIAWCIDLVGCPYLIVYPLPYGEDYDLIPIDLVRDRII
jgi:hypothetical protein